MSVNSAPLLTAPPTLRQVIESGLNLERISTDAQRVIAAELRKLEASTLSSKRIITKVQRKVRAELHEHRQLLRKLYQHERTKQISQPYIIMSLLDLPQEIIIKIIEQKCITLKDRMNIRLTCKAMEEIVSKSYFLALSDVVTIMQFAYWTAHWKTWRTQIKGLLQDTKFVKEDNCMVPLGRSISFIHLMSRLFRRAHFHKIEIIQFNFRVDLTMENAVNRMDVNQLLEFSHSLTCKTLRIVFCPFQYDQRTFDVIHILKPSKKLILYFCYVAEDENLLPIEEIEQKLLDIPTIPTLVFSQSWITFNISDSTLLSLISKHDRIILIEKFWEHLTPKTLVEATKIVAECNHILEIQFLRYRYFNLEAYFPWLMEWLRVIGVVSFRGRLTSTNPSVKITAILHKRTTNEYDYLIEVGKATISIIRASRKSNSIVRIERTAEAAPVSTRKEDSIEFDFSIFELSLFDCVVTSPKSSSSP